MASKKEYELAIKIAGEIEKSFQNSMSMTEKDLKKIARQAAASSDGVKNSFSSGFSQVENGLNSFEKNAKKVFDVAAKAAMVAATAIGGIATAAISVGSSYEAQMSTVQSITGATSSDMVLLGNKAKEMGETTVFSATEAGQAMEYMAMAGWKTNDMLDGIEGIMNLAAASGEDLASVSDIVTDALTAFGLTAKDSTKFADVLAATASNANTNVALMGETFSYVAPIAGALGYTAEDTSLAIGLMANSGIKASAAGTALRKIMTNTASGIKISSAAMGEYDIATANADGSMRELSDILPELRDAFSKMTEQEKAANAEAIGGKTAMSGLLAIVNASETDYNKLSEAINNSAGAAERMSEVRLDNLQGDFTLLKSAAEGLGIEIYEQMNGSLRGGTQGVTSIIGNMTASLKSSRFIEDWSKNLQKSLPTVIRKLKETGAAIGEFAKPFINIGKWMWEHPAIVESTLVGIGTAIVSLKIATKVVSMTKAFAGLAAVLTNPFAVAILAVGAAIGGAAGIAMYIKKCDEQMKKQSLAEHFGDISLSLEDLKEVAEHIVSNGSLDALNKSMQAMSEMDSIKSNIENTVSALDKMNWKVSIGMELTDDEKQNYKDSVASFITDTQNLLQQKQYAMSLNLQVFTDNDAEGQNIRNIFDKFYQDNYNTVAELGTKLQDAVNSAFEDGLLTIDEVKEITELQNQIANITAKLAEGEFDAKLDVIGLKFSGGDLDAESFQNLQEQIQTEVDNAVSKYDESLQMSISSANVMLNEGSIDQAQYDSMINEFKENYLEQVGDIELKAQSFQLDTIKQQYADELSTAMPEFQKEMDDYFSNIFGEDYAWSWQEKPAAMWIQLLDGLKDDETLDKETRLAIGELVENMQPSTEALENLKGKYKELGMEVPKAIQDGINDTAALGVMTRDEGSIWNLVSQYVDNNEDYTELIKGIQEKGYYVPEEIADAIDEKKSVLATEASELYGYTKQQFQMQFGKGIDIRTPLSFSAFTSPQSIPGYADGDIITSPTIATFAENSPEAAIPLNGSARSKSLWMRAGELLGMNRTSRADQAIASLDAGTSGSAAGISYAPVMQFYGSAPSKEDLNAANEDAQRKFEEMMEKYIRDNGRFSFA